MPTADGGKPTRARARRQTTQTIKEIEARIVEVREAENEALLVLVQAMREIAVRLPVQSRLPMILARYATEIADGVRLVGDHHSQATGTSNALYRLVNDLVDEQIGSMGER